MSDRGLISGAARIGARIGGATILASAALVSAEVILRNLGIGPRLHSFELTNYGFAAATAFGFAFAATERAHIRIDVVYQLLPRVARVWLDLASAVVLALLATGMAWQAWRVVAHSFRLGARPNSTLDIPLTLPQGLWALGLTWFACVAGLLAIRATTHLLCGRSDRLHAEFGVRSEAAEASDR